MRSMLGITLAAASLAGSTLIGLAPAAYADDAGSRTFWMNQPAQSATQNAPASSGNNERYTASYDYKPPATSTATRGAAEDKDIYFYHSMGTMSHP